MKKQPGSAPPEISGFRYVEHLGSGGYADVFLYRQTNPEADVAVKVLSSGDLLGGAEAFRSEADTMAMVSDHPFIVQVFRAGLAADGRPYFVMEYYPGLNFSERARGERIAVDEALSVGVRVASAVETAHRAGVLHRDIKPANILTNRYNQPGLADFGIASPAGGDVAADGMSIPWSPPEAFGDASGDIRSDVYSLAATVYTLLAGRSPFELKGGDNSQLAMIARIESTQVPPTGRADVPPSLEQVLALAMSKDPNRRPSTAAEFGRLLNGVEAGLKLAPTQLILESSTTVGRARSSADDDDATRIKGVTEIRAQGPSPVSQSQMITGVGMATPANRPLAPRRREGMLTSEEAGKTVAQLKQGLPATSDESTSHRWALAAAAAGLAVSVALGAVFLGGSGSGDDGSQLDQVQVNDGGLGVGVVALPPQPVDEVVVARNADGSYSYSWSAPDPGAEFVVTEDGGGPTRTKDVSVTGIAPCVEVETVNSVGLISSPVRGCAP